jgi:hypothetical protein
MILWLISIHTGPPGLGIRDPLADIHFRTGVAGLGIQGPLVDICLHTGAAGLRIQIRLQVCSWYPPSRRCSRFRDTMYSEWYSPSEGYGIQVPLADVHPHVDAAGLGIQGLLTDIHLYTGTTDLEITALLLISTTFTQA